MGKRMKIGIIVGSTRQGRVGLGVAEWVLGHAVNRDDADFVLVDIQEYELGLCAERLPAATGTYELESTIRWSRKIDELDGFILVTPEYNHSTSASLKNALDSLYHEWAHKGVGFVGYSWSDGIRAVEHLRMIMTNFYSLCGREQVAFNLGTDINEGEVQPRQSTTASLDKVLAEVVSLAAAGRFLKSRADEKH